MKRRAWEDVREEFRGIVLRDGVVNVARRIPAHRSTIHRLVSGQTERPSGPLRASVEKIVADATTSKGTGVVENGSGQPDVQKAE